MARFHVYLNAENGGYLLDVQANLLSHLNTCTVIPLMPQAEAPLPAKVLNPVFELDNASYVLVTQFIASVPRRLLGKEVASLEPQATEVVNALDCLFQGI